MLNEMERKFLERAIELAREGMNNGRGGPFGCVIVVNDEIVGEGCNMVASTNDPTAHAEVVAIRDACKKLNSFQLIGCDVYTSCEPCPMCLGAIYWARPSRVFFAATHEQAAAAGFDDSFIYQQIAVPHAQRTIPMIHLPDESPDRPFQEWAGKADRLRY